MAITGPKVEGWREQVEATALLCSTENHDDFIPGTAVFNSRGLKTALALTVSEYNPNSQRSFQADRTATVPRRNAE
jgi:hypothetical protein